MPNPPPLTFHPDLLAGQTALVTGSSSGLGRAIALQLAAAGANVHLHTRQNEAGLAEVRELIQQIGRGGENFRCDLSDVVACANLARDAWEVEPVDIWVNNAGADILTGDAADWDFQQKLNTLWDVDVRASLLLSRAIGERMRERGSGTIVNIGWDQVNTGMGGDSGEMFTATKGAIMAFTLSLAKSLAPQVRVNCVAPGWIRTKWAEGASEYWDRRAREESLLGTWGEPEDVAQAVCYLASPAAKFVNGQVLNINGGFAGSSS